MQMSRTIRPTLDLLPGYVYCFFIFTLLDQLANFGEPATLVRSPIMM
jgi:hypothetical protein